MQASLPINGKVDSLSDQVRPRDLEFAGDAGLAKTTGGGKLLGSVFRSLRKHGFGVKILLAFVLVMTLFGDRTYGTPLHALSTFFISEEKAVFLRVAVSPVTRRQLQVGHDTSDPHSLSSWGDEAVAETERPETARMRDMAFRPGRGPAHLIIAKRLNGRQTGRGDCQVSQILKIVDDMLS